MANIENYALVFDIPHDSVFSVWPTFIWSIVGLSIIVVSFSPWLSKNTSVIARKLRLVTLAIGAVIILLTFIDYRMKEKFKAIASDIKSGNFYVVEGNVENFHPMPASGHDTERFTVQGKKFSYSDYIITGGFNNTSSHGGPIRGGLPVRITYVAYDETPLIIKLEIGQIIQ